MEIKNDTTFERDIALLIMEELIADSEFAQIFLDAIGINEEYQFSLTLLKENQT